MDGIWKFIDNLNWVVILGIVVAIETQISNGTMSIAHSFPEAAIPAIKEWSGNLAGVGALIMSAGAFGQRPQGQFTVTPAIKAVLMAGLTLGCVLALTGDARAQTKLKLPVDPLGLNGGNIAAPGPSIFSKPATGSAITDLQSALNAKLLPDLQYALKLAQAANNTVTSDCFQAWIDIITSQQNAVKNADGTDLAMPDPHLITDFEKLVELRNALQPESKFNVKCSPVASMLKRDLASFMGIVISGGAGLATLVPGL